MTARAGPVSYILLAEFDIDQGSILKHSYPAATGTDEHLLAEHMLPDGAHDRNEDWTIFYLNQIPGLTVDTSLVPLSRSPTSEEFDDGISLAGDESGEQRKEKSKISGGGRRKDEDEGGLLYVMSLVRTKKVATVRRGALVKALAVASRYPYIQIYKPILLLALEEYFNEPSIACLSRLYSAINSMDLTSLPPLSLDERLVLRTTERKDMFEEKFLDAEVNNSQVISRSTSVLSLSHIVQPSTEEVIENLEADHRSISSAGSVSSVTSRGGLSLSIDDNQSWQGAETVGSSDEWLGRRNVNRSSTPSASTGRPKDTHWYDTKIFYSGISLPIRIPLGTFPEEVGDYSLIKLVQIFSNSSALSTTGPYHPHLHTSGSSTHPIILLFNALVSYKRVVFLGHGQAAGQVANLVLAACALGSGCGSVLKGFTDRAFPYTNLTNLDNLETVPGYIAGVCNPAFADRPAWWDVLCNVETGKIVISKDIKLDSTFPPAGVAAVSINPIEDLELAMRSSAGASGMKMPDPKVESPDNLFMDEITGAIQAHYGEAFIRSRFTDYAHRFVRLASRYEEDTLGATTIGFHSSKFSRGSSSGEAKLGSGIFFLDEASKTRELAASIGRIEGWRGTPSYHKYQASFRERAMEQPSSSQTFDILHQLASLRQSRKMSGGEAELLMHTIALQSRTEEGLLAILAQLPPHFGGLLPLAFGLFHPLPSVRNYTLDFFDILSQSPTGSKFIHSLNAFHRAAYERLAGRAPVI